MITTEIETAPIDGNFTIIPADTEIAPETRISIEHGFGPFFSKAHDLIAQSGNITSPKMAKVARLEFKALRVAGEKERVRLKAESLRFGKAVDGANAILLAAIVPHEERLEEVEKAEERRLAAEVEARRMQRRELLAPYGVSDEILNSAGLGNMDASGFQSLLDDAKGLYDARLERERIAAAEVLARQVEEAKERERIRIDNERLLREAQEREEAARVEAARVEAERVANEAKHAAELAEAAKKAQQEKDEAARVAREILLKSQEAAEAIRREQEAKAKKEKAASDAKAAKEKREAEAKARTEFDRLEREASEARAAKEKAESEARAVREAEEKRVAEEARKLREAEEAAEAAAQAPDKQKLIAYAEAILATNVPTCKSKKAKALVASIVADIQDVAETLRSQAEKL